MVKYYCFFACSTVFYKPRQLKENGMEQDREPYHITEALGLLLVGAVFGGIIWGMIYVGMVTGIKIGLPIEKPVFNSFWILIWPALGMTGALILVNQGKK